MAKEVVVGSITSMVTGAVADKAVSKLFDSLGKQTPVADKLQRLERLCMRVRSTVEVSEKHDIESASLLQWREELWKAVALGDEVLLSFQRQQQQQATPADAHGGTSAGTGSSTTALSFTMKTLWSMARRISDTAASFFLSDEDAKKLESAVEALEKASENLGEFIGLLQLEASPRLKRRRRMPFMCSFAQLDSVPGTAPRALRNSKEAAVLVERLLEALLQIVKAVHTEEYRGLEEMELQQLAQWVVFLRESNHISYSVFHALTWEDGKETPEYAHEEDEFRSFVITIESIAGDLEFFNRLITSFCQFSN